MSRDHWDGRQHWNLVASPALQPRSDTDPDFGGVKLVLNGFGYNEDAGHWRVDTHPRLLADTTGDGHLDLVGFGGGGVWVSKGRGDGTFAKAELGIADFGHNQGWRVERHARLLVDTNGDGKLDVAGFADGGLWVSRGQGDGTFAGGKWGVADFGYNQGWRVEKHLRFVVDTTGDGQVDVVGFGGGGVWVSQGRGDGQFEPCAKAPVLREFGYNQGWTVEQHPRMLVDTTGDGNPDIAGFGDDGVWVAKGQGDGTFAEAELVCGGFGYNKEAGEWRVDRHPRFVVDTTGDGRADIVGFGGPGVYVARQNPERQRLMNYTRDTLVAAPGNGRVRWSRTPY